MSSLKSMKKAGIRRISIHFSQVKSSKVGAISVSNIPENEQMMLPKCDLFNNELLPNDLKEVKNIKKTRKSSLASKPRKKFGVLDVVSDRSPQNGSNTNENKKAGKKIDSLKKRFSHSSILPGKLESTSTTRLLSDGKVLDLKDTTLENEINHSNNKSEKKLFHISKKSKETERVHGRNSNLEEHKVMKKPSNKEAKMEEINKNNYEFEFGQMKQEKSTISEVERVKSDTKPVKHYTEDKVSVESVLEFPYKSKLEHKRLESDNRQKKSSEKVLNSKCFEPENIEQKRKERKQKGNGFPIRRSARIAGMVKISYEE